MVDESGPSNPVTSVFFTQITRAESFPNLQPFLLDNPVSNRILFALRNKNPALLPPELQGGCDSPLQSCFYPLGSKYEIIKIGADPDQPHRFPLYCTHLGVEVPPFSDVHFHNLNSLFPFESAGPELDQPEGQNTNSGSEEDLIYK